MTTDTNATTNPAMGQSAPFAKRTTGGIGKRHPAHHYRHTHHQPRHAHRMTWQGKTTSHTQNPQKTAQNGANTGANKASFGMGSNQQPPRQAPSQANRQHKAKPQQKQRQRADLSRLPSPIDFYHTYGLTLKGGGVWRSALCPFHGDKHPSLSINTDHGGYICHVCGASGDMVGFYMARFGVDFVQACKDLDLYR
ncbi:CHC2 zinc finger domain-containing protein [uncultured Moraxella sp.]|uniref:CHC2 zinc finger domain-containing protein n=1 Tax=uncultured Moraxella sp. TaxID=263769 RepID=UPI0025FFD4D2|nr:CHC2 zinc finger domain-containing protein [uncultured Moraxella sp.]